MFRHFVALNHSVILFPSSAFSAEVLMAPIVGVFTANGSQLSSFFRNGLLLKAVALPTDPFPLPRERASNDRSRWSPKTWPLCLWDLPRLCWNSIAGQSPRCPVLPLPSLPHRLVLRAHPVNLCTSLSISVSASTFRFSPDSRAAAMSLTLVYTFN